MSPFDNKIKSFFNLALLSFILFLALILLLPILGKIPNHPDEYQFYFNAFRIMGGQELHNYLHIALTEYALAGFFNVLNLFTNSGVNFPQGDPSLVTFYYGRWFGLILYFLTFILGSLIIQRNKKEIKPRTVIFAVFYFGSLGLFERFLRVNSDSMSIFVFFNFIIWSFWLHQQRASVFKFFILNLIFVFLASFTNFKALYLIFPLAFVNFSLPFIFYDRKPKNSRNLKLPTLYRLILHLLGLVFGVVLLWRIFIPHPFNTRTFWYTIKNTILYGTKFDFNYPTVAFKSGQVYLYDLLATQIGFTTILALSILFFFTWRFQKKDLFRRLFSKFRSQVKLSFLKQGNLYSATELILLISFLSYYFGVSAAIVHYSRWGAPLGILAIMILSSVSEKVLSYLWPNRNKIKPKLTILLPSLFLLVWSLRIALTVDLLRSNYLNKFKLTTSSVENFLNQQGIEPEDYPQKAAWYFVSYSPGLDGIYLDKLTQPPYHEVEYLFWPFWTTGQLYSSENVDRSAHNQIAFVKRYAEEIKYRFPTLMSYYLHYTSQFAWKYLNLTWWPEIMSLAENHYGVVKLKEPLRSLKLVYEVPFKDMTHYFFPESPIFNITNLPDGYLFPVCYALPDTKYVKDGTAVIAPPETKAKTAGLHCHTVRFRALFSGTYRVRIEGLPEDSEGIQKVYSSGPFDWDPETKTITCQAPNTAISAAFGVATPERQIKDLKFIIFYKAQ